MNWFDFLFGPLDKRVCLYFLILSMLALVGGVFMLISQVTFAFANKKVNMAIVAGGVFVLFNLFLAYLVNRVMYNICERSLG
jgi:hypothetical protein